MKESVGQYIFCPVSAIWQSVGECRNFFLYGFTLNAGQKEVEILGRQCSERALELMHRLWHMRHVFLSISLFQCRTFTYFTRRNKHMRIKWDLYRDYRGKSLFILKIYTRLLIESFFIDNLINSWYNYKISEFTYHIYLYEFVIIIYVLYLCIRMYIYIHMYSYIYILNYISMICRHAHLRYTRLELLAIGTTFRACVLSISLWRSSSW